MTLLQRALGASAAAAVLTGCASAPPAAPAFPPAPRPAATAPAALPAAAWAHMASDLKPDPRVRFGVLANGMRYALMKNATPPGEASLRLRFDVGSLMERDDQLGVAHFLEHMAFNGSKNVAEGDMVKILQRHGLAFGPDTNASTGFDETIYMLELPETDDDTVDTGLMLMREAAGELLFDKAAVDRERGVVLSEERTSDTPGLRIFRKRYDFLLKGQLLPKRFPIGTREVLQRVPREGFVEFYDAYYRPERAVLIAVGDFDLDAMEAKIRARFSDWRARGKAGAEPVLGAVAPRGVETRLAVEPGGPTFAEIVWIRPPDLRPDSRAMRREEWIEKLGFDVLNRRMERLSRSASPPFIAASGQVGNDEDAAELTAVSVVMQPDRWREAVTAAEQEQRRLTQHGVTQAELDREIGERRATLTAAVAAAATRRNPELAGHISGSIDDDYVFSPPSDDLMLFEEAVKGLTPDGVNALLRSNFAGQGPLVFLTTPQPIAGGEPALAQAVAQSRQAAVAAPAAQQARVWPYTNFGTPGRVAERREVADLQTTFVRFANGVRLTVRPSKLRDDEILVTVRVGDGRLDQSRTGPNAGVMASFAFSEGGLKDMTKEEIEQALASRIYAAQLGIDDDAFNLSGRTRPEDFQLQMQVLAAYLTQPGWRPEGFERMRAYGSTLHDQFDATPGGVFGRDGALLLHSGDKRWSFPSRAEIAAGKPQDVRSLLERPLSDDPIEVIITGDVELERAIAETAATFGALPARRAPPPPASARQVAFPRPAAAPVGLKHKGRADQAIAFVAWPTTDFFADPQEARAVRLLEQVLQLRLIDEIREKQGVTYSPSTSYDASLVFPRYGFVASSIEAPPDKLQPFFADAAKIARDLRDTPVTADELERARKPRIESIEKARASNEYWLGLLEGAQTDPRRLDVIRQAISGLERVTPADLQKAARAYLSDATAWKLTVTPEPSPAAGGS